MAFEDASKSVVCAAIYAIIQSEDNVLTTNFFVTKSRVATIPCLELVAAHKLSKLISKVKRRLMRETNVMAELTALPCYAGFTKQRHGQHMYEIGHRQFRRNYQ